MNYQLGSFVNKSEAEALKDLIFKRAKERSKAMSEDIHADIMNIARESFVNNKNPFSQALPETKEEIIQAENMPEKEKTSSIHEYVEEAEEQAEEIGFPLRNLVQRAANQNMMIKNQITSAQVQNTMIEAHQELSNKKSFMGALAFLNSHAAASLFNQRAGNGVDFVA